MNTTQGEGGGKQKAKFMEIDGALREIGADHYSLSIRRREKGDMIMVKKKKIKISWRELRAKK